MTSRIIRALLVATGLCCAVTAESQAPASDQSADIAALKAEVERLRGIVPAQAVAMTQVAYNFSNLWFAVHAENWPLAQFYFNETRVRLRWALRISPTRRISSGDIALTPILEAFEGAELAALERSVSDKDLQAFEAAYRQTMNACSACHTASEKPFLRLKIPTVPAEPMIAFDATQ